MRNLHFALVWLCVAIACSCFPPRLHAWSQHRFHADLVRQTVARFLTLPGGKNRFSEQEWKEFVERYTYYPDWGWNPSAKMPDDLWEYFQAEQARQHWGNTHTMRATVVYFQLLLDNLAAGETRKAALWAGCLTHVLGDAAAANHPPLLAYLTYGYPQLDSTIGTSHEDISRNVKWLDVAGPAQDSLGKQFIHEELRDYKPSLLADDPEEAGVRLQLLLHEGWNAALKEEGFIARGFERWVGDKVPQGKERLMRGMAKLIAKCTRDTADALYTAHVLSQRKQTLDIDRVLKTGSARVAAFRKATDLADVALYDGLPKKSLSSAAIGVFLSVPGILHVTPGPVDLPLCYFMALITRSLAEQGVPYVTFDLKAPPASLDPRKVPVIILPSYSQADGLVLEEFDNMLRTYRQRGGRILLVGGHAKVRAIEPLAKYFVPSPDRDGAYPIKAKALQDKQILLTIPTSPPVRKTIPIHRVMIDFDVRTFAAEVFLQDLPAEVQPLIYLVTPDKKYAISGGLKEDGSFRVIYVPWYLFMPGSLSQERILKHVDHPTLDASGREILNLLLGLLKN